MVGVILGVVVSPVNFYLIITYTLQWLHHFQFRVIELDCEKSTAFGSLDIPIISRNCAKLGQLQRTGILYVEVADNIGRFFSAVMKRMMQVLSSLCRVMTMMTMIMTMMAEMTMMTTMTRITMMPMMMMVMQVLSSPWRVMSYLGGQYGYELLHMPIGGQYFQFCICICICNFLNGGQYFLFVLFPPCAWLATFLLEFLTVSR